MKGRAPFSVQADCLVAECIKIMANEDVGSVVVLDGVHVLGTLTYRDVMRLLAQRQEHTLSGSLSGPLAGPLPLVGELRVRDVVAKAPSA